MAANQPHTALHHRHGVAIGIAGKGLEGAAHIGGAVVKIHALDLPLPVHSGHRAVGGSNIGTGALDVLHTASALKQIEVIRISPIRAHANAQVLAAALHKAPHIVQVVFQRRSKRGGFTVTAWEDNQIHVIEKTICHFVLGENLDTGQARHGGDHAVHRIRRTNRVVQKNSDGGLHRPAHPMSVRHGKHHIANRLTRFHQFVGLHHLVKGERWQQAVL